MPFDEPARWLIGLVVVLSGWLVVHQLARQREREPRLRAFRGFLDGWRAEVEADSPRGIYEALKTKIPLFRTEAAKIRGDIKPRRKFNSIVADLSKAGWSPAETDPKKILIMIDALSDLANDA